MVNKIVYLFLAGSFLVIALLLSPFWSGIIASQVDSLRRLADRIAEGGEFPAHKTGLIQEFNGLFGYLRIMSDRIRERENALRSLNLELEHRVAKRTKELEVRNHDLRESLDNNTRMRTLLVQTEKLAALGRLVAGVAHEMNTPIGNAVMAISTLKDGQKLLAGRMEEGLRKSDLDHFLEHTEQGLEIAERNVNRAAELISSFKHVASDPGVIGQIITNLITNALIHAWDEGREGTITVTARNVAEEGRLRISVADNGIGIPESSRTKIFEPFYTTRMGRGGTGLGLNIAYNGARNVLGGNLDYNSDPGKGTTFNLDIPLVAPILQDGESS